MTERLHQQASHHIPAARKNSGPSESGPTSEEIQRAIEHPTPDTLTPSVVARLHTTHGNQFVSRLVQRSEDAQTPLRYPIQAKLTVTAADDQYEQEADAVAGDVMQQLRAGDVQREGMEEEEMMMQRDSLQRESMEEEEMMMQRDTLQREGMEEEEMMMQRDILQRDAVDYYEGGDVDTNIESQIESKRGGGQPLDDTTRGQMEGAFGADFSGVRVHTDSTSDDLNRSVQAKAFTTGSDIFFKGGAYNPGSNSGQELLAHELTHTIQQGAVGVQKRDEDKQ